MCIDCEKINTCGDKIMYSPCVIYEGFIADISPLKNKCDITVHDALEDLYTLIGNSSPIQYTNGVGLNLNNFEFSVNFGTTSTTVKRGDWKPDWEDVKNRPNIPQQVNLIEGDNVVITGIYPNLTINAIASGSSKIDSISTGGELLPISSSKNVDIPIASNRNLGVIRVGKGLSIDSNGFLNADNSGEVIHTGEVTGSTQLTITNSVVTNAKLSNMPAQTFKMNGTGATSAPQDVPLEQVKTLLDITNQTVILESFPATLDLKGRLHTAVFCMNINLSSGVVTLPDGDFDGQIVCFNFNSTKSSEGFRILGKFLLWSLTNSTVVINSLEDVPTNYNMQLLYWSEVREAWMVNRIEQ